MIIILVRANGQMGFAVWSDFSLELCSPSHGKISFLCLQMQTERLPTWGESSATGVAQGESLWSWNW